MDGLPVHPNGKSRTQQQSDPHQEDTNVHVEATTQVKQDSLRHQVAEHEQYQCAIIQAFDVTCAGFLSKQQCQEEIPRGPQSHMEATHIFPFFPNNFNKNLISSPESKDPVCTWDMLKAWTMIDIKNIAGSEINTAANCIYMTINEHITFGKLELYLEEYSETPNKYKAHRIPEGLTLGNGQVSTDVIFCDSAESGFDPPDPDLIRVHAAFAKVLHLCGAAEYVESIEMLKKLGVCIQMGAQMLECS
ncbi:hypothetical protein BDQ12DRAFT_720407 [Crucibulum laeve]|uniref:Uncharacterized protein n=1 Tax=Crucibulum laeve TaxID=68775 RepID=A0A5C3MK95_9AGAR|nr:hypothetical protein BDQ12DRAFT_720407 [Crucibulum laeve]